ncbi:MAG: hypothetical protein IJY25_01340 [Bacilli bacterium]|nr:hypothetical protein [Bacilli bacterium]
MNKLKNIYDGFTKFIKLSVIWIVNILFAKSHFKVNIFKRIYYAIFGGFMADQIVIYNLNHKNKKNYLSEFDWYKSRYINGNYSFLLNNKVVCSDLFKNDLDIPKVYCFKKGKKIYSSGNIKTYKDIIKLLKNKQSFIMKPISKGKGSDIYKIEYNTKEIKINNMVISESEIINLLKRKDNWFISDYIKQAKYLDDIYEYTTNTIRLITVRNAETKKCEVLYAVQRIGRKSSIPVDNGSKGGFVSKIDLETGELSEARTIQTNEKYDIHPDSNKIIKGVKIPNWKKIKETYTKVMEKYPYFNFVAWDILVTDSGTSLIEANTSSGVNIIQIWGGQRNKKLGKFYKEHGIIK